MPHICDIWTRTGKTFDNRHFYFLSRESLRTIFFVQITSRQFYLVIFVSWNERKLFNNQPEDKKNTSKHLLILINVN
jgi:DUF1365 family protein